MTGCKESMFLACAVFLALQAVDRPCPASVVSGQVRDLHAQKEEIKKVVYKNWKSLKPCIKVFAQSHEDAQAFVLRFKVEPGNKIGSVSTKPSDVEAAECFKSALWTMEFPPVAEALPVHLRIELPEKEGEDKPAGTTGESQEKEQAAPEKKEDHEKPEKSEKPEKAKKPGPAPLPSLPEGGGRLYVIGDKQVGACKLRSFLIDRPASARPAKQSRAYAAGGWFLRVSGLLMGISGAFLLGFGVNEYVVDEDAASWAAAFTASGACLLAAGFAFEITGRALIARSWPFFIDAVNAYNAANPDEPVQVR
jgi:hypothetical protein